MGFRPIAIPLPAWIIQKKRKKCVIYSKIKDVLKNDLVYNYSIGVSPLYRQNKTKRRY